MLLRRIVLSMSAFAAIVVAAPTSVEAQGTCTIQGVTPCTPVTLPLAVTVPVFAKMYINFGAVSALTAPDWAANADSADFADGLDVDDEDVAAVRVAANIDWKVQISGAFTTGTKTIGDVRWSIDELATSTVLTGTATDMFAGNPGALAVPANRESLSLRTKWNITDPAGNYTLTLTFTVVAD